SLDAAIGDGDHGITMRVGFSALISKISGLPDGTGIDALLKEAGLAFMGSTGGAIGVLFGKMLMAGGARLKGCQEVGPAEFRALVESMETALSGAGKAKPGDKTILDAVHAAHKALSVPGGTHEDVLAVVTDAATA